MDKKQEKKKWSYGEMTEKVIDNIADYLINDNGWYKPRPHVILGLLIKLILIKRKEAIKKWQINKVIRNLEKRDIISLEEKDGTVYVSIQDKGKPIILKHSLKALLDFKKKKKKWNGRWFFVFFDVPEAQRNKRNYLRKFLQTLGFYRYQKSVYLFPYECEKEVVLIKKIVEGAKYIKYIIAEKIEDETLAKTFFNL